MRDDRDAFERMLAALADDSPADWENEVQPSDPAFAQRFARLQELARIARFHRTLQRSHDDAAEATPSEWGPFKLLERLAHVERAEVWRAWDPALRRDVALKLMRAGAFSGAASEAALLDEARAAARVSHPHVVVVHGVARHGDRVGLWMELVRGPSLEAIVRQSGALAAAEAAALGADLASALAAVHQAGVLHRDIKPANVIRDTTGRWVLADFGLGLSADRRASLAHVSAGTPMYMAPELFKGEAPSAASDQYALGLLLWFALTAQDAFPAASVDERARLAAQGEPPTLRQAGAAVPAALAAIVERALAPDPSARHASAAAFEAALRAWPGKAPVRRSAWVAAASLTAVALAAFALWRAAPRASRAPGSVAPVPAAASTYAVEASMVRRAAGRSERLSDGARVGPGDQLSLQLQVTRRAWVYVLNEDEHGERYLLFPQPLFDTPNPVPADSALVLPGTIGGRENAWAVTSRGGHEHFLIVVSPGPVATLEAELARIPAPSTGRAVAYAPVGDAAVERLRGVGGVTPLPPTPRAGAHTSTAFDAFRPLAARESGVRGVWVRQVVLENPLK